MSARGASNRRPRVRAGALVLAAMSVLVFAGGADVVVAGPDTATWAPSRIEVRLADEVLGRALRWHVEIDQVRDAVDAARVVLEGDDGVAVARGLSLSDSMDCRDMMPSSVGAVLFTGEIVAIEPSFSQKGSPSVVVRAFNRMHRLTRGRKTRTFAEMTDREIVGVIADENDLDPKPGPDLTERHDLVVQNNETDLNFLKRLAARNGYIVRVEHEDLIVDVPAPYDLVSIAPRKPDGDVPLIEFHPKLSSSQQVQKVIVRGWDPEKKEPVIGSAQHPTVLLLPEFDGPSDDPLLGRVVEVDVGEEVQTDAEAATLAMSLLDMLTMPLVSAEARCVGNGGLRAEHEVDVAGLGPRFDGKYLVQGATHRYSNPGGGFETLVSLRRDDGGLYFIPEINDEVLVAFEHGDIRFPVIVGSLWNDPATPGRH